jgi:demethylmenaquinone methyltransferase/2-methoxy-6-polyprenyl-1,4-benzoquinol methylase
MKQPQPTMIHPRESDRPAFNRSELRQIYRRRAPRYGLSSHAYGLLAYRLGAYRRHGIDALELRRGDTVVEIGCGTGANLADLQKAVGPSGRIIGVDLTDAMLEQARRRATRHGWGNVELIECDAASFEFPAAVDGVLSTYALTLIESYDEVVRRAAAALAPGRRMVVVDFKAPSSWPEWLLRAIVPLVRPFGVTLDLADRQPWTSMARHLDLISMDEYYLGTTYVAIARKPM